MFLFWIIVSLGAAAPLLAVEDLEGHRGGLRFERLNSPEPPHRSVFALHQDSDGFLWIGTQDGLARYDGYEMRVFRHHPGDRRSLSNSSVRTILEDRRGRLWIGTENGLNILDRKQLTITRIPTPDHPEGRGAWFHCAFADRDGVLWFGTDDGLLRHQPDTEIFQLTRSNNSGHEGLAHTAIVGIEQDADGAIWVATGDLTSHALHRLGRQGAVHSRFLLGGPPSRRHAFLIDSRGRFWTHPSAPIDLNPGHGAADLRPGADLCSETRTIIERTDGGIWFACDDGLHQVEPASGELVSYPIGPSDGNWLENFGRSLVEDLPGTLWVGTEGGLFRHDPNSKEFLQLHRNPLNPRSLSADAVSAVAEAPNNHLWVATYGGGLNHVDRATGEARPFCIDSLRPERCTSDVIWDLHTSADGRLWIAGDELWSLDRLTLAPGDTTAAFTFAALSFTSPELNRYAYQLEGFDEAWTEAGTRRTTQYTNLPPGHYRLRVKGSNDDGVWNEKGTSLEVVVHPTLWETLWFRPMLIMILGAAIWAGCRYRVNRQRELERLRMRIAGDLHDDLSSDLSGIAVLADMVRQSEGLGAEERDDLVQIRDASMRMVDGLRDIVWYIDPDHDSLEAMARRIRSVGSTLLRGIDQNYQIELPDRTVPMPVNTRRNVFLIFKEAVHNIVRHADASRVDITVVASVERLHLAVSDDGVGFDPASARDGHGLRSMQRRADESGAILVIESGPDDGSRLRLTVEMAGSRDGRQARSGPMVDAFDSRGRRE